MITETDVAPDVAAIRQDLEHMTRRWHELGQPVMFEVRAFKPHSSPQTAKFAPSWIDEAVDWVASMNRLGFNTYAVRNPLAAHYKGSAKDTDVVAAFFLWADCDDQTAAGNVLRWSGPKWSAAVKTGTVPTTRVHTYWELAEPVTDLAEWRDTQAAIAQHFGSDKSVINPSRIMRIAGTVAYPDEAKQRRGYVNELTTIRTIYDEPRAPVTIEQMRRAFGTTAPQPAATSFQIDAGAPPLDRERLAIQAQSGQEWHNSVIRLVASYVGKGLSDDEIHTLTDPLTLSGYTVDQTRREVQAAIDGARRKGWTPPPPLQIETAPDAPGTFDAPSPPPSAPLEWFDDITPVLSGAYLVKGVLDDGAMSVVYGPSNSGKTFFALDLAYHIAIGSSWRGRRVTQAGVLYLAAEGGRGVANRIAALRHEHGVCDVPLALRRAGLDLLREQADLQHIYDLSQEVRARVPGQPLLIVIDTLSRIMAGGDENSAADMTALIRNIDALRHATGAHIMLVHHTGKDTARGARGHSSLRAATDTEIEVGTVGEEDTTRAAMVTKQRDHNGGETFAFTLKSVSLGFDQDGDEVTSCVVEEADSEEFTAARAAKKGIGGNQKIVLDAFDMLVADGYGTPNPGGTGYPEPGRHMTVSYDDLRRVAQGKMTAKDAGKVFRQAFEALTDNRGVLCMADKCVWRTDRRIK